MERKLNECSQINGAGNSDIMVGNSHLKYVTSEEKKDGTKVEQQP